MDDCKGRIEEKNVAGGGGGKRPWPKWGTAPEFVFKDWENNCEWVADEIRTTHFPTTRQKLNHFSQSAVIFVWCVVTPFGLASVFSTVPIFGVLHRRNTYLQGHPVAQLVKALRYKPEGRGVDSWWCHWNWHNPSGYTMALVSTQPLTEMSTRNISWGVKAADGYGLPYRLQVPIVLKSGSLIFYIFMIFNDANQCVNMPEYIGRMLSDKWIVRHIIYV